jgi:hypothetical protein
MVEEKKKTNKISKFFNKGTTPSNAVSRPMGNLGNASKKKGKSDKNEIFVDIYEKLSVLFNSNGSVINS